MNPNEQPGADVVAAAVEHACRSIAPNWPLDRQIAVNPYWGHRSDPFEQALARLDRLMGAPATMPASYYLQAWESGEIGARHLARAADEFGLRPDPDALVRAARLPPPERTARRLLSDCVDVGRDLRHEPAWRDVITQQVSQHCASFFDREQADWHLQARSGLYATWHRVICADHSVALLMGAPDVRRRARELPPEAMEAIRRMLDRLAVPPEATAEFLQVVLLRIHGWAAWCAYLRWESSLAGAVDDHIVDLLAIRLAWEFLVDDGRRDEPSPWADWRREWTGRVTEEPATTPSIPVVWQRAHEIAYQDPLFGRLTRAGAQAQAAAGATEPARAQVVFCIDVRSERLRRALEALDSGITTHGFAGFFGLPIEYTPIGSTAPRRLLPGLLAPRLQVTDTTGDQDFDRSVGDLRRRRLNAARSLRSFQRLPTSAFSLVESLGLAYAGKLLRASFSRTLPDVDAEGLDDREIERLRPSFAAADSAADAGRLDVVASILRAMSLTSGFARLLVLVGHGSSSANNPHAAGLDCGACGGHAGGVNARLLARILNDPHVRHGLCRHGIVIPDTTVAVAGLHNTTTDQVQIFDAADLPATHREDLERLTGSLRGAGLRTRAERAASLGLDASANSPVALERAVSRRSRDWAQTRPEWGLADNAAFLAAPRSWTRGMDLQGRSFLHDYCWQDDADGRVLELIMTAPMIVAHWINMQYYASTVAPRHFGSGNKILHNVVGGRIGVFEGNSGDLRIGLPRQSVHDGVRWMHAPLRLSVLIAAPRAMIERVLGTQPSVRELVDHGWLYLYRWEGAVIERTVRGLWQRWTAPSPVSSIKFA
ncbi:MAG: DUF2309 domain-containing protein [Proteobacteria bacterium]|nr:DUF2309 domain-containing protein [Pseudomonadota bacterium]